MTNHHLPIRSAPRPTYAHDCNDCMFLGTTTSRHMPVDCYYHPSSGNGGVILARLSSEPSDYLSAHCSLTGTPYPPNGSSELLACYHLLVAHFTGEPT